MYRLFDKIVIFNISLWRKISVTKFQKYKIRDDSFEGFSAGFVVVYSIFSLDLVFMEKFAKQNGCKMDAALNTIKSVHFVFQISPRKHGLQKKWSTPRRSQQKILRNCHLRFLFLKLCHRDFPPKGNVKIMIL